MYGTETKMESEITTKFSSGISCFKTLHSFQVSMNFWFQVEVFQFNARIFPVHWPGLKLYPLSSNRVEISVWAKIFGMKSQANF